MISEKEQNEKRLQQHLYKYYDVLHWGEDLNTFLNENITYFHNYNGKFLEFTDNNIIIGGLIFYFNKEVNSHVIGCAAIDPSHRRKGHYKQILTFINNLYPRLYLFCQPHLLNYYLRIFTYKKEIKDKNIYLISNYETTIEDKGPYF